MARFVNYKKRQVTLPKGCKDLGDLLVTPKPEDFPIVLEWPSAVNFSKPRLEEITVKELTPLLSLLFEPSAKRPEMVLLTPMEQELIGLSWMAEPAGVKGAFCFPENGEAVLKARAFFEGLGMRHTSFCLEEPELEATLYECSYLIFAPLAASPVELGGILRKFFINFLGLSDETLIQYFKT